MRRGNLPGGGHEKVIWKRSGDLLTRHCDKVSLWRGGDVPHWVFHLGLTGGVAGTYWWDVVDMYHWDILVTYQWDGCWMSDVSSLDVSFETFLKRRKDVLTRQRYYVLLRRCHDIPIICRGYVPLRRLGEVSSKRRWVFHLRRTYDVAGAYKETSLRRFHDVFLPSGEILFRRSAFYMKTQIRLRNYSNLTHR